MNYKQALIKELTSLLRKAKGKGVIKMYVNGQEYGEYDCSVEQSIDSKSPTEWLNGNLIFMKFRFGKIESVNLKLVK